MPRPKGSSAGVMAERGRKWNWDLFAALYLGGMETSQIIENVDEFKGLSRRYCEHYIHVHKLAGLRREQRAKGAAWLNQSLAELLARAKEEHQRWLQDRLEKERRVMNSALLTYSGQSERLSNLKLIDDMARRSTGLDNDPPPSDAMKVFGVLVYLQDGKRPIKRATATDTPSDAKEATAGILSAANGDVEGDAKEAIDTVEHVEGNDTLIQTAASDLKLLSPFTPKPKEKTILEKAEQQEVTGEDLIDTLRKNGYDAFEIAPGKDEQPREPKSAGEAEAKAAYEAGSPEVLVNESETSESNASSSIKADEATGTGDGNDGGLAD